MAEPEFLGFLEWSDGTDCPCGQGVRRLTVTKLWHNLGEDTRGAAWGFAGLVRGHYLQATSNGWSSEPNTVFALNRLSGLVAGPEFYQTEAGFNFPPAVVVDGPWIQYTWTVDVLTRETSVTLSIPYTQAMVLEDLLNLWESAPSAILVVPWGRESALGRAEVSGLRWRQDPVSWLGVGPADGRIVQVTEPQDSFQGATNFGVQTQWSQSRVSRQLLQFSHRGFFSVQRQDAVAREGENFQIRDYPKEFFYLTDGIWEIGSPAPSVDEMTLYWEGDYLVTVLLGDRPPDGTPYQEVQGKGFASSAC
ncbi:MAG: hypothetical protein JNK85_05010 [Verrucomicrobiales bacterium]|nr:hypothetical protein [Verrucomicrobiales bacterium]